MNETKPLQPGGQPEQVEELEREIQRLLTEIEGLKKKVKDLEEELRASKRQAAPFSKGQRKANPKRPGRKARQDDFQNRQQHGAQNRRPHGAADSGSRQYDRPVDRQAESERGDVRPRHVELDGMDLPSRGSRGLPR